MQTTVKRRLDLNVYVGRKCVATAGTPWSGVVTRTAREYFYVIWTKKDGSVSGECSYYIGSIPDYEWFSWAKTPIQRENVTTRLP